MLLAMPGWIAAFQVILFISHANVILILAFIYAILYCALQQFVSKNE